MSIIETDTIKHTRDLIADTISSGVDVLNDSIDLSDVTDTITEVTTVAAVKGGRGAVRVYRTVRSHPRGAGLTVLSVLGVVGLLVWFRRRKAADEQAELHVARAA